MTVNFAGMAIVLAIVGGLFVYRLRSMIRGVKISQTKILLISAYVIGFSALVISTSFTSSQTNLPTPYAILYAAIFVGSAFYSYRHSKAHLVFWKKNSDDGSMSSAIYAKGGAAILVFYLIALISRIILSFIFFGGSLLLASGNALIAEQDENAVGALIIAGIVDSLLVGGAGLLAGRNAMILERFRRIKKGKESVAEFDSH